MKKFFVATDLMIYTLTLYPLFALPFIIGSCFIDSWFISLICIVNILLFFIVLPIGLKQNAFSQIIISEDGIRNKYLFLTWEEIDIMNYSLLRVYERKRTLKTIDFNSWIVIGDNSGSSISLSRKRAVFFSLHRKTLDYLERFKSKSKVVSDIMEKYHCKR